MEYPLMIPRGLLGWFHFTLAKVSPIRSNMKSVGGEGTIQ